MRLIALLCIAIFQLGAAVLQGPFDGDYCMEKLSDASLEEFYNCYQRRPIKTNLGGLQAVGMYYLWFLTKKVDPEIIIESGIWAGQSTWLLEQAAPKAKVISIDPALHFRKYISKDVTYTETDFSKLDLSKYSEKKVLCFFDDHQDAYERVRQAYEKGFKYLIFDDNYPPGSGSHFTLRHCLHMPEHAEKAFELRSLIKNYWMMPQLVRAPNKSFKFSKMFQKTPALWEKLSAAPPDLKKVMELFYSDAPTYRWMTFVELNDKPT